MDHIKLQLEKKIPALKLLIAKELRELERSKRPSRIDSAYKLGLLDGYLAVAEDLLKKLKKMKGK